MKVVASDLDGTVVRSDDTVSAYTHAVFARVREAGIPVVGATGRGPRLLDLSRGDLPAASYLVMAGGGQVLKLTGPEPVVLRDVRVDGPAVAALLDELETVAGRLTVMVEPLAETGPELWGELDPIWPWPERVAPMPRAEALAGEVVKVFVRVEGMDVADLLAMARQVMPPSKATLTDAGLGFVEICPPGVDKSTGLAVVAADLRLRPRDAVVFGDAPNDVPMFQWAGHRVAMANAHPEVKELADEVTLTNDEDGVAVWLERWLGSVGSHGNP